MGGREWEGGGEGGRVRVSVSVSGREGGRGRGRESACVSMSGREGVGGRGRRRGRKRL